jgi:hypothetical protein
MALSPDLRYVESFALGELKHLLDLRVDREDLPLLRLC